MVGKKGLKLRVYENGSYEDETVVFFNLHYGTRGAKDKNDVMARVSFSTVYVITPKHVSIFYIYISSNDGLHV